MKKQMGHGYLPCVNCLEVRLVDEKKFGVSRFGERSVKATR